MASLKCQEYRISWFLTALCLIGTLLGTSSCNVRNASFSFSSGNGRSVTIRGSGESREITVRIDDGQTKSELHSKGRVEFSTDDSSVDKLAQNGRFRVKQETDAGDREVEAVPDESGNIVFHYRVDGASADFDAQAKEWFGTMVKLAVHETPIGAEPRAHRILLQQGADGLLEEIQRVKNGGALGSYFQVLLASDEISPEVLAKAAEVAGREVSSSSSLSKILSEIAARQPDNEAAMLAVIQATGAISSSSARQECLSAIARGDALTPAVAIAAVQSAAKISSSSSKTKALRSILAAAPADPDVFMAYAEAVESISSSSSQGEAMEALLNKEGVDSRSLTRAVNTIGKISSSSTKAKTLVKLIRVAPNDAELFRVCLDAVKKISSSSSQEDAMEALLSRNDLDRSTLRHAADTIKHISSTSTREKLQQQIIEKLAAPR